VQVALPDDGCLPKKSNKKNGDQNGLNRLSCKHCRGKQAEWGSTGRNFGCIDSIVIFLYGKYAEILNCITKVNIILK
jgi:hypothetical protein